MSPPTEQLIRDYLNRLSVAARDRLGPADRRALVDRTRKLIERRSDFAGRPTLLEVGKVLARLGDPAVLVEQECRRLAALRGDVSSGGQHSGPSQPPDQADALDLAELTGPGSRGFLGRALRRESGRAWRARSGWLVAVPSENGAAGSGASDSGAAGSGASDSGAAGSGAPGTSAAGSGAPGTGAPGSGAAGSGAPGSGAPGTGAPDTGATGSSAPVPGSVPLTPPWPSVVAPQGAAAPYPMPDLPAANGTAAGAGQASADPGDARDGDAAAVAVSDTNGMNETNGLNSTNGTATTPGPETGEEYDFVIPALAVTTRAARLIARLASAAWEQPLEATAIILLGLGGAIFPPVFALGALVALGSRRWHYRDKWVGLALPPVVTVIAVAAAVAVGGRNHGLHDGWVCLTIVSRLAALLGAGYLAWRTGRGHRPPPVPPWHA